MKNLNFIPFVSLHLFLFFILSQQPVFANNYTDNISEEYLRSQFTFAAGDKLKYAECKKKSYPTCTYIWGAEHKKDEARLKAGLAPKGNKLKSSMPRRVVKRILSVCLQLIRMRKKLKV